MSKKISFCITCMNRLSHLQETLVKNIKDNFLPEDVEFILLDYNSDDGLEQWVKTLKDLIDIKILVYYKTFSPKYYHRAHSRNMALRLSNADLVCNLDADNYLGFGFGAYLLEEFKKKGQEKIFITSNYSKRDIVGRICMYKSDFMKIGGYNELLSGYGVEDIELIDRLKNIKLKQIFFNDDKFYRAIEHSCQERISHEYMYNHLIHIYLSYINPDKTEFLLLYDNSLCEAGSLINNYLYNFDFQSDSTDINNRCFDKRFRIIIEGTINKYQWVDLGDKIKLTLKNSIRIFNKIDSRITDSFSTFHKVTNPDIQALFIMYLTEASNFEKIIKFRTLNNTVNIHGFGQGVVFKNFDNQTIISLK